jgi:biotin-(acetyl-CoA carboxylase) ligase
MIRKVFENENASIPFIMAKNVLKCFFEIYSSFKNPTKYIDIYRKRCALSGQKIKYIDNEKKYRCRVLGIDSECKLIIEDKDKQLKQIGNPKSVIIPSKIKFKTKKK